MPTGRWYRGLQVQMTVERQTKPHMPKYEIFEERREREWTNAGTETDGDNYYSSLFLCAPQVVCCDLPSGSTDAPGSRTNFSKSNQQIPGFSFPRRTTSRAQCRF
ncbi:hypothetical protein CEXT_36201 [Caerostris extrusa]|uniref:Uncharacterized protein n=1 Tax=Caerostris extrusa TaxID=172846 RepID=A0AAV4MF52_CAEEX|nr:hypothetical protein CEXT_36201 [Caerostris extrusa]